MIDLNSILQSVEPITLAEMDNVKLMNRTETKFAFHISKLGSILTQIEPFYRILEVEGNRISRYESLYFDTPELKLFSSHHSGKLNRYKIRYRKYVESGIGFFEVKFKTNKNRTLKTRISSLEPTEFFEEKTTKFIHKQTPYLANTLKPTIWTNYNRITLVNKTSAERLTLDLQLEFVKNNQQLQYNQLVIAEVKQEGKAFSPFMAFMKQMHIRSASLSKYCMGISNTFTNIKTNNFKRKITFLDKFKNDN